jgi:6-phosphogluconolactonase (cycloisomerase 2 family)
MTPKLLRATFLLLVLLLPLAGSAWASTMNATTVAISPDGARVYTGFNGVSFSVYGRDASTGRLTLLGASPDTPTGGALFHPSIAVSPDSANIYGVDGEGNHLWQYAPASEGVVSQQSYPVREDPTIAKDPITLAVSPDGTGVYVLTYGYSSSGPGVVSRGAVTAFQRDAGSGDVSGGGSLSLVGTTVVDCCGIAIDPVVSPDSKFVYIADSAVRGGIVVLSRNTSTSALTQRGNDGDLNGGTALAISPDGKFVYEAGTPSSQTSFGASAISVLTRDPTTGRLIPIDTIQDGVGGVSGLSNIASLAVSNDGRCLYATSRPDNSLAAFTRDPATGAVTFSGVLTEGSGGVNGLTDPRQVTVSADDKNVYVASAGDNGAAVFARNGATCVPTYVQLVQDLFTLDQPVINPLAGTATLPVTADEAGTLAISVTPSSTSSSAHAAAAGPAPTRVGAGQTVKLPVTLDQQAQQQLDTHHQLDVRAAVTYNTAGGVPTTKVTTVHMVKAPEPVASVPGRVGTVGATLKFTVRCDGPAGKSCQGAASAKAIETLSANGKQVTGVVKTKPRKGRSKTVEVAKGSFSAKTGRTTDVSIKLNATGRSLRSKFTNLPASVEVTATTSGGTTKIRTAQVVFGPDPPKVSIAGTPTTKHGTVSVSLRCKDPANQACTGAAKLTTVEKLTPDGKKVTGLAAGTGGTGKTVTIGSTNYTVKAGKTAKVTIKLNQTGRNLLSTFGQIPATLTITPTHNGYTLTPITRKITLKR